MKSIIKWVYSLFYDIETDDSTFCYIVKKRKEKKYNILQIGSFKLKYKEWFDKLERNNIEVGGIISPKETRVEFIGTIIDKGSVVIEGNGDLLFETFYPTVRPFKGGYYYIEKEWNGEEKNVINSFGNLLSSKWFRQLTQEPSDDGLFLVQLQNKTYNFLTKDYMFLFKRNYKHLESFNSKSILQFARVQLDDGKYSLIDKFEDFYCKENYNEVTPLLPYKEVNGSYTIVMNDDEQYNYVTSEGVPISKEWFDDAEPFYGDIAEVTIYGRCINFINIYGEYIYKDWFMQKSDNYSFKKDGFVEVTRLDEDPIRVYKDEEDRTPFTIQRVMEFYKFCMLNGDPIEIGEKVRKKKEEMGVTSLTQLKEEQREEMLNFLKSL